MVQHGLGLRFSSLLIHVLIQQGLLLLVAQVSLPCQRPGQGWKGLFQMQDPTDTSLIHVSCMYLVMYEQGITGQYVTHVRPQYYECINDVLVDVSVMYCWTIRQPFSARAKGGRDIKGEIFDGW